MLQRGINEYVRRVLHSAKGGGAANMKAVAFAYTIQVSRMDYSVDQKASVALALSEVLGTRKKQSAPSRPFRVEREE